MIRTNVYKSYKKLINEPTKVKLLKQQVFLSSYINDNYDNIDKMLLFHGIGTGKTYTSITIAETIMKKDPKMKALVILPARLKTNFIDELKGLKNYEIISYEYLRKLLLTSKDYKKEIEKITKDRIIIIDEVHNLLSGSIKEETIKSILNSNKIDKDIPSINAIILRLLTTLGDKTAKFFFLTATPVFDNYGQFIQLVFNLRPDANKKKIKDLSYLINLLKGKISFYKFNDKSVFPNVITDNIKIKITNKQWDLINTLIKDKFCIGERQLLISAGKDLKNAPKLLKLFELLKLSGKHVVYSNFIDYCLKLIIKYLNSHGWSNYLDNKPNPYKTYILWDASLKDADKIKVKKVLNSRENMSGKLIRVVLGSPSIKEGISFRHVQHLHQIDPVWNASAKDQIEGRVIRFKSHADIPLTHPFLKREVIIHNYIGISPVEGTTTCDEKIYNDIMIKKKELVTEIETLLKKVSIDYYLWDYKKSPKTHSKSSYITVTSAEDKLKSLINVKHKLKKGNISSCPKPRRPEDNICKNLKYPYMYKNKKGDYCCYVRPEKIKKI